MGSINITVLRTYNNYKKVPLFLKLKKKIVIKEIFNTVC